MVADDEERFDIPEPEEAAPPPDGDTSPYDPGGEEPPVPAVEPGLGEHPEYDPGGLGRQPDIAEEAEEYGG